MFCLPLLLLVVVMAVAPSGLYAESRMERVIATGTVLRPALDTNVGVPRIWVTLHRVGSGNAGPVDSVLTDRSGRYSIPFRRQVGSQDIYFSAALHDGIAYFSAPIGMGDNEGAEEYDLIVFDTTSRKLPIYSRGRHLVITSPDDRGMRRVTEVFELANDSLYTVVASGDEISDAVWSTPMLPGARNPELIEGDLSAQAVKFTDGRLYVYAPIAPGLKQVAYFYEVPSEEFPVSMPIESPTSVFEILVEDASAMVTGTRLQQVAPVVLEGAHFTRYLGSDLPINSVYRIDLPARQARIAPWALVLVTIVIGGGMVGALTWAMRSRKSREEGFAG